MTAISGGRLRTLALQAVATAVTALLLGGAAVAMGQPLGEPTVTATDLPTETVTDGPTVGVTEDPTEEVTEDPTEGVTEDPTENVTADPTEEVTGEPTEDSASTDDASGHGQAVSKAARGLTPPVGNCRNHGHWVSTVAKGLSSCDDNPRPAKAQVDEPATPANAAPVAKPVKPGKPAKAAAAANSGKDNARKGKGRGNRR